MTLVPGPGCCVGYCTNVHAGVTLAEMKRNLAEHAVVVRELWSPGAPMGIGLWLAADAAAELASEADALRTFRGWLDDRGLFVFTINGFPYGDFHQPVVKHRVYEPDWSTVDRARYTQNLMTVLTGLIDAGGEGSISTLPLKWRAHAYQKAETDVAASFHELARHARRIEDEHGVLIHLDIEPEPGCELDRAADVVAFFEDQLLVGAADEEALRRHIRVCHDVCHSAVMFEDQRTAIDQYDSAGINIGTVQVSSAICARLNGRSDRERSDVLSELAAFAEDRYLHQTVVRDGGDLTFYEDLPQALEHYRQSDRAGDEWRVHFHVPIDVASFGLLHTTNDQIDTCIELLGGRVQHWEIETYAWSVLPPHLRAASLAEGIARELEWFVNRARQVGSAES